jgi:hypothetical protein
MQYDPDDLSSLPPEEMMILICTDLRAFIGVVGSWAEVLSGEIYQELRPQAIESLRVCAENMQLVHNEIRRYLVERKKQQSEQDGAGVG